MKYNLLNNENIDVYVDVKWLIKNCIKSNSPHIFIKYMAIEDFYGNNNDGFKNYHIVQKKRLSEISKSIKKISYSENEFISLIKSFEKNGYDENYPILLNKNLELVDGDHRLACCLYFGIDKVKISTNEKIFELPMHDYSFEWFRKNNLEWLIPIVEEKQEVIYNE